MDTTYMKTCTVLCGKQIAYANAKQLHELSHDAAVALCIYQIFIILTSENVIPTAYCKLQSIL
jgi:hypothetical protein